MIWILAIVAAFLVGCGDAASPTSSVISTTVVTAPSGALLRLANLSADLAGAEVRLDGAIIRDTVGYPQVTGYRRVDPGTHRIRFIPSAKTPIDARTVQLDIELTIATGEAVTLVAAGLVDTRTLSLAVFQDELAANGDGTRLRLRLINAMSDFPAPLELWLRAGSPVLRNVQYLEDRGYRAVTRGNYPLEVRRQGTRGPLIPVVPYGLAGNATYTMFAYGTLRKGDLDALLVLDGSQGGPALRR